MKIYISFILLVALLTSCYCRKFTGLSPLENAFTDSRDRDDEKYGMYNAHWVYLYSKYDKVKSINEGTVVAVYNLGDMYSVVVKSDSCQYVYHNMRKVVVSKGQPVIYSSLIGYANTKGKKYLLKFEDNCKVFR